MTHDLAPLWPRLHAELRRSVTEGAYDTWLAPLQAGAVEEGTLVLHAPSAIRSWVQDRYGSLLLRAARDVAGGGIDRVDVRDVAGARAAAPRTAQPREAGAGILPTAAEGRLNPKFTFEQFVIGDSNRFAHAAALAVAELPGQAYNPLFLYGPPGVGKTHLLQSIANYLEAYGSGMRVRYTTAERFTNEFLAALHGGDVESFKGRYRHNDVLLIDDVQFLQAKVRTEEEFFHTFTALQETGSQVVLTCDRLPRDLGELEARLRERFESGLLADIAPPDRATRFTVLRKRVHHDGIELADDTVLEVLAERITGNIRALEGALIRVVAFASLQDAAVTGTLATEVLDSLYGDRPTSRFGRTEITVEAVQTLVADSFGLTRDELLSPSRAARVTWPRQIAMFLAREHTDESLPAIGARFGGRDHTTVMHACKRTAERIARDSEAYETIRALTDRLTRQDADRSC